jgi:tetratricopeptide (TPR) repeat protein
VTSSETPQASSVRVLLHAVRRKWTAYWTFVDTHFSFARVIIVAKALTSFAVWLLWVALSVWIFALLITSVADRTTEIDGISVPKILADNGYTPEVAANRLRDALKKYANNALDRYVAPPGSQMKSTRFGLQAEIPDIVVPTVGISLSTIVSSLRTFLGIKTHKSISGEFFLEKNLLHLTLRLDGDELYSSGDGINSNNPDDLVALALPRIFSAIQPYVTASAEPNSAQAMKLADAIISKFPESDENVVWAYVLKGDVFRDQKQYAEAEKSVRKAIVLNKRLAVPHLVLGLVLADQGDQDGAILEFTNAIGLESKFAAAFNDRGRAYDAEKDYDRAIADFTQANHIDPREAMYIYNRGHVFQELGTTNLAIDDYTEAIRLNPKDALAFNNRGTVYSLEQKNDRAIADFSEAIKLEPQNSDYHYNRGSTYSDVKDYDRAIADYSEAIRLDPQSVKGHINRGNAYSAKSEYNLAIADYGEAIRLNPRAALAYSYRGDSYLKTGDLDAGISDLNTAIRMGLRSSFGYTSLGHAYLAKGDYRRAIADYDEAKKLDPQDAGNYFNRGIAEIYGGLLSESLADLEHARELNREYPYTALWVDIAARRQGAPSPLSQAISSLDMTVWPAPVIRLFLDQATIDDVLNAAQDVAAEKRKGALCEGNFYGGVLAHLQASEDLANRLLRAAAADCPRDYIEWRTALAELRTFGASP